MAHISFCGGTQHIRNQLGQDGTHLANNDRLLRQVLGIHTELIGMEEKEFPYQTMVDNVSLVDESLLEQINQIVAEHGHTLLKKKKKSSLNSRPIAMPWKPISTFQRI
jgi:hypothetical protein